MSTCEWGEIFGTFTECLMDPVDVNLYIDMKPLMEPIDIKPLSEPLDIKPPTNLKYLIKSVGLNPVFEPLPKLPTSEEIAEEKKHKYRLEYYRTYNKISREKKALETRSCKPITESPTSEEIKMENKRLNRLEYYKAYNKRRRYKQQQLKCGGEDVLKLARRYRAGLRYSKLWSKRKNHQAYMDYSIEVSKQNADEYLKSYPTDQDFIDAEKQKKRDLRKKRWLLDKRKKKKQ